MTYRAQTFIAGVMLVASLLGWPAQASAHCAEETSQAAAGRNAERLIQALRAGGLVVVMRHAKTDPDEADRDPLNPDNVTTQRWLTDTGRLNAKGVGTLFFAQRIPVSHVHTSLYRRATETAEYANFGVASVVGGQRVLQPAPVHPMRELSLIGEMLAPKVSDEHVQALRALATRSPATGNVVVITHEPNIQAALHIDDMEEGEMAVIRPLPNGKFSVLGRMRVKDWSDFKHGRKNATPART